LRILTWTWWRAINLPEKKGVGRGKQYMKQNFMPNDYWTNKNVMLGEAGKLMLRPFGKGLKGYRGKKKEVKEKQRKKRKFDEF
jgi:hypothetical protein